MKRTLRIFGIVYLLFAAFSAKSQSTSDTVITDPIAYNDFIVEQQNYIGLEIKVFSSIISDTTSYKSEAVAELEVLKSAVEKSTKNLKRLKQLNPDFNMKSQAVNLFGFYKRIMETYYVDFLDELYVEIPDMDNLNVLLDKITDEEAVYDNAYADAQKAFAEHYNISLEENTLYEEE